MSEKTEEEFIDEVVQPRRKFINENPELLSVLYDIDLLPEQIKMPVNAVRMAAFCELYKRYLDNNKKKEADNGTPSTPEVLSGG